MIERARIRFTRLLALGTIAGILISVGIVSRAPGRDVADIVVGEGQTVSKDYEPILAVEPPVGVLFGNALRAPATCRDNGTYCDVIDLTIDVPPDYLSQNFFRVDLELRWPDSTGINNLNLYVHRPDGVQVLSGATTTQPERVTLQDPLSTKYHLVVSNAQGLNTGYTLSAKFVHQGRLEPLEEGEIFQFGGSAGLPSDPSDDDMIELPGPGLLPGQFLPAAGVFAQNLPTPDGGTLTEGPRLVEQPGADGPPAARPLVPLAVASPPDRASDRPVILAACMAAIAVAGLAAFLFVRGRRNMEF